MRLIRNQYKRTYKTAARAQKRKAGAEGLGCPVCNPRLSRRRRRETARNRADARHMVGEE